MLNYSAIAYQMCSMNYMQQAEHLGGPIGILKAYCTRCAGEIADDAVQIFGGRGITQGGMGGLVEMVSRDRMLGVSAHLSNAPSIVQFQRTQKFDAILGGAEEVLNDLGVRQASRKMGKYKAVL